MTPLWKGAASVHIEFPVPIPAQKKIPRLLKRSMDLLFAGIGLLLLSPVFLVMWCWIRLDSPGPGFYQGTRIGLYGKPFGMYKFRTMVAAAEALGPPITRDADPRITRLGRRLRARRIDELPQLVNVLRGEMSLVGPRPEAPEYVRLYNPEQLQLLTVKPGVTGPMQIQYLDEEAELTAADEMDDLYVNRIMPAKLALELTYLQDQSFWYDLTILWRTFWALWPSFWG
jgi:lipopolysaccharide/colanic/teichoic acid biosynthesis glycosyltransferase